jgi:hypothetical protein
MVEIGTQVGSEDEDEREEEPVPSERTEVQMRPSD